MANKLRRTLYIGLGGTGQKAILETKKRIMETYGEIPPMIGFLVIDTDQNAFNKTITTRFQDFPTVSLNGNEQAKITVSNPQVIYAENTELFSWMPPENTRAMTTIQFGAGQVRTTGRFASFCNYHTLYNIINEKITQIADASIIDDKKFELANNNLEVHMAFSFAGGTGSGIFVDTAYILRKITKDSFATLHCKVFGYAVLPDIFVRMGGGGAGMKRVMPNGYGALKDIDFLMHLRPSSMPIVIDYGGGNRITSKEKPFDTLMMIDNRNLNNMIYTDINDIAELLSLALTMGSSEVGDDLQSLMDNVVVNMNGGMMDVEDKSAWASGLGLCELFYDGNKLGNIYAEKVIARIINGLLNVGGDTNNIVNTWIDSPEVLIRENNGRDDIISRLLNPLPNIQFLDFTNPKNPTPEIDGFLNTNQVKADKDHLQKLSKEIIEDIKLKLKVLLIDQTNKEYGVGNSISILNDLTGQITIFEAELKIETEKFTNLILNLENQRNSAENELKRTAKLGPFAINRARQLQIAQENLVNLVNDLGKSYREVERRNYALQIFNALQTEVNSYKDKYHELRTNLKDVLTKTIAKIDDLQNGVNESNKTFVIELQDKYAKEILVDELDASISEFVSLLDGNKIYDFLSMRNDLIRDKFWNYAKEVKGAMAWRNKSIEEVLRNLSDQSLALVIEQAIKRSSPLFSYDYKGLAMGKTIETSFFVGVPNRDNSVFIDNDLFKKSVLGQQKINFTSTGMKDRIIIYRQIASVPAYTLNGLEAMEAEYAELSKNHIHNFHIDRNWQQRMEREEYSLYPNRGRDNSLELWVKAIIFGFIKNENDKYYVQSKALGDPLDDYWFILGNSEYRDDAFSNFKNQLKQLRNELEVSLTKKQEEMGTAQLENLKKSITSTNYITDYSQLKKDLSLMRNDARKYENALELLRKEVDYISNDLKA